MAKNYKKPLKVALSVFFVCSLVFTLGFPAFASTGAAAKTPGEVTYNDIIYYKWTKVTAYDDNAALAAQIGTDEKTPRPVMIMHTKDNDLNYRYYLTAENGYVWKKPNESIATFTGYNTSDDPYMSYDNEFITSDTRKAFYFQFAGYDTDNEKGPRYNILFPDQEGKPSKRALSGNGASRYYFKYLPDITAGEPEPWTITCMKVHMVPAPTGKQAFVKIINNVNVWKDQYFGFDKKKNNFISSFDADWEDCDNMELYVATPINYSSINYDYTLQSNQTLNAKDNIILKEGCTLTIEKDAVLSIDGQFYNNGTIINKGTLVINENSAISPFDSRKSGSGSIICEAGGDIVMLKGSKLATDKKGKITLKDGATLVNSGTIIVGGSLDILEATLDIRENGTVFLGYGFKQSLAFIKELAVTKSKGTASMPYMVDSLILPPTTDTFASIKNYSTILDKNAKIVNSGVIMLNHTLLSYADKINYFPQKNGTINQTGNSLYCNASYKVNTNGKDYLYDEQKRLTDIWNMQNDYRSNKRFWSTIT